MNKVLCLNCGKYEGFYFEEEPAIIEYKGEIVSYTAKKAYCNKCNQEVDVPGLWDENLVRIKQAYSKR